MEVSEQLWCCALEQNLEGNEAALEVDSGRRCCRGVRAGELTGPRLQEENGR